MFPDKYNLTIMFQDPFWIGLFEREGGGGCEVCKVTFGAEPRDCEVWDFVLKRQAGLKFSPAVEGKTAREGEVNPKRMRRQVRKSLEKAAVGTKAQRALALQREAGKKERESVSRERRQAEEERRRQLKTEKKREKHRGR